MSEDRYGCSLSTENPEAVELADMFSGAFVHFEKNMEGIVEAVEKYPDEIILQIYAAIFYLYGQTFENQRKASRHLDHASHLLDCANDREKSLYSFAWHWLHKLLSEALREIEKHCFKWPKDLTAIKITEFLFYCKGQQYESKRFLRLTSHCYHLHKENPFFLAIHALALELNRKYAESLQTVGCALQLHGENPLAQQALSRIYLKKGWIDEGIRLLEHSSHSWKKFHRTVESRNFWHLALLYMENLDFDKVQDIYQRAGWGHGAQLVEETLDAIALLWHLDLEGRGLTIQWRRIADAVGSYVHFVGAPLLSVHLCYALKKGEKEHLLQRMVSDIETCAEEQSHEDCLVWKEVGLPLLYGSLAHAEGNHAQTVFHLEPIIDNMGCAGGNDVQLDLFYRVYLKGLMGMQRYAEAESLLHAMTQGRDMTKLERKWLAQIQEAEL